VAKDKAAHHAISAPFPTPIDFSTKPLVVQYEVKYQRGGVCGGGYLKLLEDGFQTSGKEFSDNTPWVIMFGPDLTCPGTKVLLRANKRMFVIDDFSYFRFTSFFVIKTPSQGNSKKSILHLLPSQPSESSPIFTRSLYS
jgi:hypothetical protein